MEPTRDHEEIRRWAEAHDGVPAEVIPYIFDSQPSILHFLFGSAKTGTPELRPISWEDFFTRLDLLGLAVAFDEEFPIYEVVRVEKTGQGRLQH